MTHGAPDYSNVQKHGGMFRLDDMAELAARLGSPLSYDRRGDIFWSYDFSEGRGDFTFSASGASAAILLNNVYFDTPPYSLEMKSSTVDGDYARIYRLFPVPYNLLMGFALTVKPTSATHRTEMNIMHYTGSILHNTKLIVDYGESEITISNKEDDPYTIVDGVDYLRGSFVFNHYKLVIDLNDHSLVRFGLNNNSYSLAGYTMKEEASATKERIYMDVVNKNTSAESTEMYVDNLIITTNEV